MVNLLYLLAVILGVSGQSIAKKPYTQRFGGEGSYSFVALSAAAAFVFFAVLTPTPQFNAAFFPYAAGFAAAYVTSSVFTILAIAYGSLSLSSLVVSYSLLLPTLYGVLVLHDPLGVGFFPGLLLLAISLFLINKGTGITKPTLKWTVCAALAFVGNGMCTVVQKMQQVRFDGAYKSEFMMTTLALVFVVMLLLSGIKERKAVVHHVKHGWHRALIVGGLNGMVNLFVMILSNRMPVSLLFPFVSAGGLIVTYLVARFWYKEPLRRSQLIGFVCGIASVVFLNL